MSIAPITPEDVIPAKLEVIPDDVITVWNTLIAKNYTNGSSVVTQDEAVVALCYKMLVTRAEVFLRKWLDIEEIYHEAGWDVVYDKPAYNENYEAKFTFKKA